MSQNITQLALDLFPIINDLLTPRFEQAGSSSGSSSGSTVLSTADYPDALLRDGSRSLLGDLSVAAGKTVDGVDISELSASYLAHLTNDAHNIYIRKATADIITAAHTFQNTITARQINPQTNDTYDLGTELLRWRQMFVSELETIILKYNSIMAVDGAIVLGKQNGTLQADVSAVATTMDFGQAMINGNIIYIAGNNKVEYVTVGAVVTGTTYNVTRNVDGSGADAWYSGQVWINYGTTGDVRIELAGGSTNTPRIRLLQQGATYNAVTTQLTLDTSGIALLTPNAYQGVRGRYRFMRSDSNDYAWLAGYADTTDSATYGTTELVSYSLLLAKRAYTVLRADNAFVANGKAEIELISSVNPGSGIQSPLINLDIGLNTKLQVSDTVTKLYDNLLRAGGTSFPSNPADSDLFYRTDRDLWYFYSSASSQWLSQQIFTAPVTDIRALAPYTSAMFPGTESIVMTWGINNRSYAVRLVETFIYYGLGATNSGASYWHYRMNYDNSDVSSATDLIGTAATPLNTSALAASATGVASATDTTIAVNAKGGRVAMYLKTTGTPSPAAFRAEVHYRYVG